MIFFSIDYTKHMFSKKKIQISMARKIERYKMWSPLLVRAFFLTAPAQD